MGSHDTLEQLEAARDENVRLEAENRRLQQIIESLRPEYRTRAHTPLEATEVDDYYDVETRSATPWTLMQETTRLQRARSELIKKGENV